MMARSATGSLLKPISVVIFHILVLGLVQVVVMELDATAGNRWFYLFFVEISVLILRCECILFGCRFDKNDDGFSVERE